jgi:ATP-binding cassette subfamily B protein RaxB
VKVIFQSENSECGLAAIAMVASSFGYLIDISNLRARYPVSQKGTNLQGIVKIGRELGLESRAVRCEPEDLVHLKLPAILHWNLKHFVVLVKCHKGRYTLHDPAYGRIVVSKEEMGKCFTGIAMEAWPGPKFEKKDVRNALSIRSILPRMGGIKRALSSIFVYAMGVELIILVLPILQQIIIDDALVTADSDLLVLLVIATGVFLIGAAAASGIRRLIQRNLSSSLSMVVPTHVFQHLGTLPVSWFEKRSAADVVNRVESANTIHKTLTTNVVTAGIDGLVALLTFVAMFLYSPSLAFIVLISTIAYGLVRVVSYNTYRTRSHEALVHRASVQSLMWETMRGIATIKAFNGAAKREEKYSASLSRLVSVEMSIATADTVFAFAHDVIRIIERIAILYLGARAVLNGSFTVGMLIAFLSFRDNFVQKGASLINTAIQFKMLGIHLDRLADILLTEPEHRTDLPFLGDREMKGCLEIRNISYRYGENEGDVLKNCSLKIEPAEIVAIVGPSGAGKSTLFKVLSGEFEPRTGDVMIDGISTSAMGFERLREMVAVVRQDDMLFEGTIAENIAFMQEKTDHERVTEVSKLTQIYDEIQQMPMGFNTLIGSLGTGLSGGQLQRIILARALYRRPSVLLLDEATSSLDVENERQISFALRGLGITQVIIAHRPETIAQADRVIDIRTIKGGFAENVISIDSKEDRDSSQ